MKIAASRPGFRKPVTGQIVTMPLTLNFEASGRQSEYDKLLNRLLDAPADHVLEFQEARCRTTVCTRARKLGLKIALAEQDGKLYVKLLRIEARVVQTSAKKPCMAEIVKQIVGEAPRTTSEIFHHVHRVLDDATTAVVSSVLETLRQAGEVSKKDDLKWYLVGGKHS